MKVFYDSHTDTLNVILKDNVAVHESDEDKPGVILDYDKEGDLISLEILDASKRVTDTRKVDFRSNHSNKFCDPFQLLVLPAHHGRLDVSVVLRLVEGCAPFKTFKVELSSKRQDWDFLNASLKSKHCIVKVELV
jgi:uncharacterized protein YuzE